MSDEERDSRQPAFELSRSVIQPKFVSDREAWEWFSNLPSPLENEIAPEILGKQDRAFFEVVVIETEVVEAEASGEWARNLLEHERNRDSH